MKIWADKCNLFDHCVAIGLASILANEGYRVSLYWPSERGIQVDTHSSFDKELSEVNDDIKIAELAVGYAKKVLEAGWLLEGQFFSWPPKSIDGEGKITAKSNAVSSLNPHTKPKDDKHWNAYQKCRCSCFDSETMREDMLAQMEFQNLGLPSRWSWETKTKNRLSDGTSRWEMFNHARGDNFSGKYYVGICKKVAELYKNMDDAASSIRGDLQSPYYVNGDELTHGLCQKERPVNYLQLWCALHAFSCFPTRPVVPSSKYSSASNTVGYIRAKSGSGKFCMPVFNHPVYLERYKSVMRSYLLYEACSERSKNTDVSEIMSKLGVDAIYVFQETVDKSMESNTLHWAQLGKRVL